MRGGKGKKAREGEEGMDGPTNSNSWIRTCILPIVN